jgi:3-deoxy-D-manno-octulosonic-acid transferase
MNKILAKVLYRLMIFPLIFTGAHISSLFSAKIRAGLLPRYKSIGKLAEWIEKNRPVNRIILIHAASLGEFEHIKPLLLHFKNDFLTVNVVTFFSPSGYRHVKKTNTLDLFMYMPFDTRRSWKKVYSLLNPSMVIVAKHDVWPNQIWTAREMHIPIYLINGSLAEISTRSMPMVRNFLTMVYKDFNMIYAISGEDRARFETFYPGCRVEVMGDTKYDQVILRKQAAEKQKLISENWIKDKFTIVAGSIWPEDNEHLLPALKKMLMMYSQVNLILIPHQPEVKAVRNLVNYFQDWEIAVFSKNEPLQEQRILIIDAVGYLAGIYAYASVAFVGGSFRQGVHNVMEPAIFGIPVLYGPVHKNSYEAIKLAEQNGALIVSATEDIENWLAKFIQDPQVCRQIGKQAENFVLNNTGATNRLLANWRERLTSPAV